MAASRLRVLFRVAAGPRVGFGHLVRATRLAAALDADCSVSIAGQKPRRNGHDKARWPQGFNPAARRLALVSSGRRVLDAVKPSLLVLDTPTAADALRWTAAARRRGIRVASVHDLGIAPVRSDLAIDGSVNAGVIAGATRTLAGPRFALVDPRCVTACRTASKSQNVFIALGGGPRTRAALAIANAVRRIAPTSTIHVAAGFVGAGGAAAGIRVLGPQRSLVPHLSRADVAVVAGGVTAYEAAAVGVPAVALAVVPAQRRTVRGLDAAGAVVDSGITLGTGGRVQYDEARIIADQVRRLMTGRGVSTGRAVVDGRGIERVARELMRLAGRERRAA